jgi:hypothetical protein
VVYGRGNMSSHHQSIKLAFAGGKEKIMIFVFPLLLFVLQ